MNASDINNTIENTIAYDNIRKGKKAVVSSSTKNSDQGRRNRSMNMNNSFKMSQMKFKNRYDLCLNYPRCYYYYYHVVRRKE